MRYYAESSEEQDQETSEKWLPNSDEEQNWAKNTQQEALISCQSKRWSALSCSSIRIYHNMPRHPHMVRSYEDGPAVHLPHWRVSHLRYEVPSCGLGMGDGGHENDDGEKVASSAENPFDVNNGVTPHYKKTSEFSTRRTKADLCYSSAGNNRSIAR